MEYDGQKLFPFFAQAIKSLSEGELLQLEKAQTFDITEEEYFAICEAKTASLFRTALLSGAHSVWTPHQQHQYGPALEKAAYHLGMAFQIRDDILDYSPQVDTGKPPYRDILEAKVTLPLLGALRQCPSKNEKGRVPEWIRQSVAGSHIALQRIVQFIEEHRGLEYARLVQERHQSACRENLLQLPEGEWRDCLLQIAGR